MIKHRTFFYLIASLLMLVLLSGPAMAGDSEQDWVDEQAAKLSEGGDAVDSGTAFTPLYNKGPECFMSLDYRGIEGPAPKVWVLQDGTDVAFNPVYIRLDGAAWLRTVGNSQEALPCFKAKNGSPAWLCPEMPVPPVPEEATIVEETAAVAEIPAIEPKTFVVYFDFDKSTLKDESIAVLEEAVEYASQGGISNITLASFCDFRGSAAYNKTLGQKRADVVQTWFDDAGVTIPYTVENNGKIKSLVRALLEGTAFCKDCWNDRRTEITIE